MGNIEAVEAKGLAPPERWPAVLRSPPWEEPGKGKGGALTAAVVALDALPYEETMTWLDGERQAWLAKDPAGLSLEQVLQNRQKHSLKVLHAAHLGDAEARKLLPGFQLPSLALARLELPVALTAWSLLRPGRWQCETGGLEVFLARAPLPAILDKLLQFVSVQTAPHQYHLVLPVDSPRLAPPMAMLFNRDRKLRDYARTWLRRHPRAAIVGLVPPALSPKPEPRQDALEALLFFAAEGHRDLLMAIAGDYGVAAEIAAILEHDPLALLPAKIPAKPAFWDAASLPPPRLPSGEALPPQAIDRLGTMLSFSRADRPYASIAQVKEACDAGSLADFSWKLFESWMAAGAPAKEQWALLALGILGDDSCARRLAPLIRQWPGETAHARAVLGLEVLAQIGSDVALMLLQNIADKVKFKGLQASARQKIELIASQRGLSAEDLADRLVPDFGLDDNGSLELDFGSRSFRVVFDEQLRPQVLEAGGQKLSDLPKPGKADDAKLAGAAVERFKALKKDVKSLAGMLILRLEQAMLIERRFSRQVFETFLAHHPLIRHLARRLVWAAHQAEATDYFRVAEDGTYTDAADRARQLPADAKISVPHPISLPAAAHAAFGQIFADYQILQPFAQLGREVRHLEAAELAQDELLRFAGRELPTTRLLALEKLGWRRGAPQDDGLSLWFERHLGDKTIYLRFHDGIAAGDIHLFPQQKLEGVTLGHGQGGDWYRKELKFAALSPIEASEMLRDLERLVG